MKILVTAFGPFDGRFENASSLALSGLKREFPRINRRVLPVDSVIAPARMNRALRQLAPDAVVMLGEAAGSTCIRLERTAWNQLDFDIPDAAGRQPRKREIQPDAPGILPSTLGWDAIHARLENAGHDVSFSDDPGRYLCNQLLFHTLHRIAKRALPSMAGFIHLPLADDYPTPRAVDALAHVIRELLDGYAGKPFLPHLRSGVTG